jgi:CDP-diacylglycerol---serine O-phosphatidyltransferase
MSRKTMVSRKATALLVYSRPFLAFGGMLCAVAVMWNRNSALYAVGVTLLFVSMAFDLADGWFAARFEPNPTLAQLADRIMDKTVYSIIFPLIAAGMMWKLAFVSPEPSRIELLHAIFVVLLCIAVLIRDNFAGFMRGFAIRQGQEPEPAEYTRLRTVVAAPVGALLYAYAFYIPEAPLGPPSRLYDWISWLGHLPIRLLFFIEILFFIITFGSIAQYCRKYGNNCLDELCLDDERLRRQILSFFPNALTVMNAMMGFLAVFFAYQGRIREAFLFIIGGAMFDKLDGALARRLGLADPPPDAAEKPRRVNVGSILDDLADAVTFCIVPAWIYVITFAEVSDPFLARLAVGPMALLYALAGGARLIYFTLDKNPIPGFFKGMPTPAAALFVTAPLIVFDQAMVAGVGWARFWGVFCMGTLLVASAMMNVYPIRYLHLGRFVSRKPWFGRASLLLLLSVVFTPYLGHVSFLYMFLYLLSPFLTGGIDPREAARERRTTEPEE